MVKLILAMSKYIVLIIVVFRMYFLFCYIYDPF